MYLFKTAPTRRDQSDSCLCWQAQRQFNFSVVKTLDTEMKQKEKKKKRFNQIKRYANSLPQFLITYIVCCNTNADRDQDLLRGKSGNKWLQLSAYFKVNDSLNSIRYWRCIPLQLQCSSVFIINTLKRTHLHVYNIKKKKQSCSY